tara:strand:+ start:50 stop:280 length:231 start_codon:yes stop_codon:yes gene_type:complete
MTENILKNLIENKKEKNNYYSYKSRWENMNVKIHENGRLIAVTKQGIFPSFAFWVDDELYQEYSNYKNQLNNNEVN